MNLPHFTFFYLFFGSFFLFLFYLLHYMPCGRGEGEEGEYMETPYWCHAPIFYDGSDVHMGGAGIDGCLPASINYQLIE